MHAKGAILGSGGFGTFVALEVSRNGNSAYAILLDDNHNISTLTLRFCLEIGPDLASDNFQVFVIFPDFYNLPYRFEILGAAQALPLQLR